MTFDSIASTGRCSRPSRKTPPRLPADCNSVSVLFPRKRRPAPCCTARLLFTKAARRKLALSRHCAPGEPAGGPGGLEVEAAGEAVDVEQLAREEEAGTKLALHGLKIDFAQA